jgi:nucleoside-diphosphate-sugar epimerase
MGMLAGSRALVTGGTGFIGGRLVEKLVLEQGARVRVLTTNYAGAARVSRFDVEIVRGDVTDAGRVRQVAQGCDVIFHCAYGSRGSDAMRRHVTVEGTRAVLDAALAVAAKRVVHVSTMVVYGVGIDGHLDERSPRRPSGVGYADAKIEAEALAFSYARRRGAPVTIIQPTAVYGPFAPSWTTRVLQTLQAGQVILVDDGVGHANPVYIDDVVDAMVLAAARDEAVGEAFLIASGETVTWRSYYAAYEAMLGTSSTVSMTSAEARAYYRQSQRRRGFLHELRAIAREDRAVRARLTRTREVATLVALLSPLAGSTMIAKLRKGGGPSQRTLVPLHARAPGPRTAPVHPKQIEFLAARTIVSVDKARRVLGFEPSFDFARGIDLTAQWARWANLLPNEGSV